MNRFSIAAFWAVSFFACSSRADPITVACVGSNFCPVANSAEDPFLITASANGIIGSTVSSSLEEDVQIEFTGGPAPLLGGYFMPCLSVGPGAGFNSTASGQFGGISITSNDDQPKTSCDQTGPPGSGLPFTFGVQSTYQLGLQASAYFGPSSGGESTAQLLGFEIFNSSGDPILANLTYSIVTPEPTTAWLLLPTTACLALIGLRRKRQ